MRREECDIKVLEGVSPREVNEYMEGRNRTILSYSAFLRFIRFFYLTLDIVFITAIVYDTLLKNLQQ